MVNSLGGDGVGVLGVLAEAAVDVASGSDIVGTSEGSTKTEAGSEVASNAPSMAPKAANTRITAIHLPRAIQLQLPNPDEPEPKRIQRKDVKMQRRKE